MTIFYFFVTKRDDQMARKSQWLCKITFQNFWGNQNFILTFFTSSDRQKLQNSYLRNDNRTYVQCIRVRPQRFLNRCRETWIRSITLNLPLQRPSLTEPVLNTLKWFTRPSIPNWNFFTNPRKKSSIPFTLTSRLLLQKLKILPLHHTPLICF